METRREELLQLQSDITEIEAEFSMILQHLKWDRKHLLEDSPKVVCKYNANHKVLQENQENHESQCRLAYNGYSKEDKMLPDPFDNDAKTLIRLSKDDIKQIITQAANLDSSFKKVFSKIIFGAAQYPFDLNIDIEPQTLDRLQSTYTRDERRAIYDAVVQAAPFCHDLSGLALPSEQGQEDTSKKQKSRLEILAELRNMKRRRTKYRVAAKTRNYSDVLRDVIKTQMEVYTNVKVEDSETITSDGKWKDNLKLESNKEHRLSRNDSFRPTEYNDNYRKYKKEKFTNRYDEDRPSNSKTSRHNDEIDFNTKHKEHKDRRYDDNRKERDRYLNRDSRRYDDRYNGERMKERSKEHLKYKRYEHGSSKESKKYERSNAGKHRREKHSSSREQREEQDHSKSHYIKNEHESRKYIKKYSEYRK